MKRRVITGVHILHFVVVFTIFFFYKMTEMRLVRLILDVM